MVVADMVGAVCSQRDGAGSYVRYLVKYSLMLCSREGCGAGGASGGGDFAAGGAALSSHHTTSAALIRVILCTAGISRCASQSFSTLTTGSSSTSACHTKFSAPGLMTGTGSSSCTPGTAGFSASTSRRASASWIAVLAGSSGVSTTKVSDTYGVLASPRFGFETRQRPESGGCAPAASSKSKNASICSCFERLTNSWKISIRPSSA